MSFQGQSRSVGLLSFWILNSHWLSCGLKLWENENESQRKAQICSSMDNLGPFGPIVTRFFTAYHLLFYSVIGAASTSKWSNDLRASCSWPPRHHTGAQPPNVERSKVLQLTRCLWLSLAPKVERSGVLQLTRSIEFVVELSLAGGFPLYSCILHH